MADFRPSKISRTLEGELNLKIFAMGLVNSWKLFLIIFPLLCTRKEETTTRKVEKPIQLEKPQPNEWQARDR